MDLKEKVKSLPPSPGVYLMKDSQNSIIYVGKSKNLKSRVGSYFISSKSHPPKVVKMVKSIKDFDYMLVDTEFEAFMLECKLIKEIKPHYNKKMKSPLSYPYLKITMDKEYPYMEMSYEKDKTGSCLYFGPYTNKNTLERGIQGIKECCRILCNNNFRKTSSCLNYSLGLCIGMCLKETSRKQYLEIIHNIIGLLNGTDNTILEEMERMMNSSAEKFDFENAAKYRDYIGAVNYLINKAKVIEFTEANQNIAFIEYISENVLKFFLIKGSKVLFSEKYDLNNINFHELKNNLMKSILLYFKANTSDNMAVTRDEVDEAQIIYTYIKFEANNCKHVIIPQIWIENKMDDNLDDSLSILLNI